MENIKIINPYEDYEVPQMEQADGVYGNDLLGRVQSLQVGFGTKVLRIDRDGLWMGSEDFATAPFSVDMDGNMSATSLDLSDYLQVGEALDDLQSDIFDLSDINDDLGTIVAGTLVGLTVIGGTVKTSNTGSRVEMDGNSDSLKIYSGTTKRMELDADELRFYDSGGSEASTVHANGNALDIDVGEYSYVSVNFDNDTNPAGLQVYETGGNDVIWFAGGLLGSNIISHFARTDFNGNELDDVGDIIPDGTRVKDLGNSSNYWDKLYVEDIYMYNGIIVDLSMIAWEGSSSNPSGDGSMVYYDSGGSEGLRMQFGGSDFQFDASGV